MLSQGMIRSKWSTVRQRVDSQIGRDGAFECNAAKNRSNTAQRGPNFRDAGRVFEGTPYSWQDRRQDYRERRWITMGPVDGRLLVVVRTQREGSTRIFSFRKDNSRERKDYEEATR